MQKICDNPITHSLKLMICHILIWMIGALYAHVNKQVNSQLSLCILVNLLPAISLKLVLFDYWIFHNQSSKIIGQEVSIDDRL